MGSAPATAKTGRAFIRHIAAAPIAAFQSGTHLGPFVHPLVGSLPPTGKRFAVQQMHLTRLRDGRVVEHWAVRDDLAMLHQLGMVFMPAEANEVH